MAVFYVPRPSSEENWGGRLQNLPPSRVLLNLLAGNPFPQKFWKYDYDDAAFWLRSSRSITTLQMPVVAPLPFRPPYWQFNYSESGFWLNASRPITTLQMPAAGVLPFRPPYWQFNYNDASFWSGTPNRGIPFLDRPAVISIPFRRTYWKQNYNDASFWSGERSRSAFLPSSILSPVITAQILSTHEIQLPVNCVLIGDQVYEPGKQPLSGNLFKSIFRE